VFLVLLRVYHDYLIEHSDEPLLREPALERAVNDWGRRAFPDDMKEKREA
jgi:hypothetical protein